MHAALDENTLFVLHLAHLRLGRRLKAVIREGWETGAYDHRVARDRDDEATLQRLRNSHGPRWLASVSFAQMFDGKALKKSGLDVCVRAGLIGETKYGS